MSVDTMRAIVMRAPGGPEVLEVRQVPRPAVRDGEVRVRVATSGINRADLMQRRGLYPAPAGWPNDILGLEFSGHVEALGAGADEAEGADGFEIGQAVMGLVGGGGYAEYVTVPARQLLPTPAGLDVVTAGALPEAFLTAFDALNLQMQVKAGETVLIHAVGSGVGTAALQLAHASGARTLGTARTAAKLEAARGLGLDEPLHVEGPGWHERVLSLTGGRGVDVIIDLVGAPYLADNLASLTTRGRMIVVGVPGGRAAEIDLRGLMARRASITGTVLRARPDEEKAALAQEARRRLIPQFERRALRPVLERTWTPAQAAEAHAFMEANRNFGKLLIDWTGD